MEFHSLEEGLDRDRHQAPLPPVDVGEELRHRPGRKDGMVDREHEKAEKLCQRLSQREMGAMRCSPKLSLILQESVFTKVREQNTLAGQVMAETSDQTYPVPTTSPEAMDKPLHSSSGKFYPCCTLLGHLQLLWGNLHPPIQAPCCRCRLFALAGLFQRLSCRKQG